MKDAVIYPIRKEGESSNVVLHVEPRAAYRRLRLVSSNFFSRKKGKPQPSYLTLLRGQKR